MWDSSVEGKLVFSVRMWGSHEIVSVPNSSSSNQTDCSVCELKFRLRVEFACGIVPLKVNWCQDLDVRLSNLMVIFDICSVVMPSVFARMCIINL